MGNEINNLYEFGEFRLDTKERVLFRENETIILAPKVFDTLETLLKSNGKIVSKDDLMNEIWADSFVEESNLTQNIYVLRQTIGKEFIETVPRRGYRFAADVRIASLAEITESFDAANNSGDIVVAQRTRTHIVEEEFVNDSPKISATARSKKVYLAFAALLSAVLISGAFGFWVWDNNENAAFDRTQFTGLTDSGDVSSLAISPKSKFLAYTTINAENGNSLYLKDIKLDQNVKIETSTEINPIFLRFSPDGDYIYFLNKKWKQANTDVYKITRFGGDLELVAEGVSSEFSFSKDGSQIVFVRENHQTNEFHLVIRNLKTKEETILLSKSFPEGLSIALSPVWSNAEDKIYAVTRKQGLIYSNLISVDLKTKLETQIPTPEWLKLIVQLAKTPNDRELILSARLNGKSPQIFKIDLETNQLKRITNDLNSYRKFSVSDDGKSIAVLQFISSSVIKLLPGGNMNGATREITSGTFGRDGRFGLEVLPDGKVLYSSNTSGNRELWTFDLNNNSKRQLTKDTHDPSQNPAFSPNGRHIYFMSGLKRAVNIRRMDLDGQNQTQITSEKESNSVFPAVSPDAETLYFIRQTKGASEIRTMKLPDGKSEKLNLPKEMVPESFLEISPDGRFLAFQQAGKNANEQKDLEEAINVGIVSLNGSLSAPKYFQTTTKQPVIRWTPTSDAFDFVENAPTGAIIWRQPIFTEGPAEVVLELPRKELFNFIWMPNSNDLLISDTRTQNDVFLITNFD